MERTISRPGREPRRGWRRTSVPLLVAALTAVLLPTVAVRSAEAAPVPDAVETSTPAVTSLSPGRLDLFWRASNGTLRHRLKLAGGSWSVEMDLGGALASQPSVVSWTAGRIDVFARGTDGRLVHRWYVNGSGWSVWEALPGAFRSAPSVVTWGPGRLHVLARGLDDALVVRSYTSGFGWSPWQRIGGRLTSSPSAAAWAPGRIDAFTRADDGSVRHTWLTGSIWAPFENLGGVSTSQPAAASTGDGKLAVVVRATDNSFRIKSYARGSGWTTYVNRAGVFPTGPAAAAIAGILTVTGRGTFGDPYLGLQWPNGAWQAWSAVDPLLPVRRLGTWVDVFDYNLDPVASVTDMAGRGVRTLYLSTARFSDGADFHDVGAAGRWLDAAHARGMSVVGWYVPAYGDMARDVRRTLAIARYTSPGGQRFDAVGVDIERFDEVSRTTFNSRAVTHLQQVRGGTVHLLVGIVPAPFATDPGTNWVGFPWSGIRPYIDVVEPMAFWAFRDNFSPAQVRTWIADQVRRARTLTGKPAAVEGGVDDPGVEKTPVTSDRVAAFVDGARDGGALGGSHYDYATTVPSFWSYLARLNTF